MNVKDLWKPVIYQNKRILPMEEMFHIACDTSNIEEPQEIELDYFYGSDDTVTLSNIKNSFYFVFNFKTYETYFKINNVRKDVPTYPIVKFLVEINLIKPIKTGGQPMKDDEFDKAMENRAGGRKNLKTQEINDVSEHDYKDQDVIDVIKEDFVKILEKHRNKTVEYLLQLIKDGKENF